MKRFDLYGSCSMDVMEVVRALEVGLVAEFVEHESGYRGGVYFRLSSGGEELLIQANGEDTEGCLPEPEFPRCQTLVYVNGSERWAALRTAFGEAGLDSLRSETV